MYPTVVSDEVIRSVPILKSCTADRGPASVSAASSLRDQTSNAGQSAAEVLSARRGGWCRAGRRGIRGSRSAYTSGRNRGQCSWEESPRGGWHVATRGIGSSLVRTERPRHRAERVRAQPGGLTFQSGASADDRRAGGGLENPPPGPTGTQVAVSKRESSATRAGTSRREATTSSTNPKALASAAVMKLSRSQAFSTTS